MGWKKFASSETSTLPFISYTYNRKPNAASTPTVTKSVQYGGHTYVSYPDPALRSVATDPDGNGVRVTFQVHTSTTTSASTLVASCESASTASGQLASCVPSPGLPDNTTLYVRAAVRDIPDSQMLI